MGLWIRSHFDYDTIHYEARSGFQTNLYSVQGEVMLYRSNLYWEEPRGIGVHYSRLSAKSEKGYHLASDLDSSNGRHFWNRLGFKLLSRHERPDRKVHVIFVSAPCWALAGLFAALPAIHFLRLYRRRWLMRNRRAAGRCIVCGYDLRATLDRCAECGTRQPKQ